MVILKPFENVDDAPPSCVSAPVFEIEKSVVVATPVDEAILKSVVFVSPTGAKIESFAFGVVVPIPIRPVAPFITKFALFDVSALLRPKSLPFVERNTEFAAIGTLALPYANAACAAPVLSSKFSPEYADAFVFWKIAFTPPLPDAPYTASSVVVATPLTVRPPVAVPLPIVLDASEMNPPCKRESPVVVAPPEIVRPVAAPPAPIVVLANDRNPAENVASPLHVLASDRIVVDAAPPPVVRQVPFTAKQPFVMLKPTFDVEVAVPEIARPDSVVVPLPVFEIVRKFFVDEPTTNAKVVEERFEVSTARRAHGVVVPMPTPVRCTPPAPSDSL